MITLSLGTVHLKLLLTLLSRLVESFFLFFLTLTLFMFSLSFLPPTHLVHLYLYIYFHFSLLRDPGSCESLLLVSLAAQYYTSLTMKHLSVTIAGLLSYHVIAGAVYKKELETLDSLPPKDDRREPLRLQTLPGERERKKRERLPLFLPLILLHFCTCLLTSEPINSSFIYRFNLFLSLLFHPSLFMSSLVFIIACRQLVDSGDFNFYLVACFSLSLSLSFKVTRPSRRNHCLFTLYTHT